jgi:hypothetical protein
MMEASPSAPVVPEADLLLELLVIAFDAPAHFGDIDELSLMSVGRVASQYLVGSISASGYRPAATPRWLSGDSTIVPDTHTHACKREDSQLDEPSATDRASVFRQSTHHLFVRSDRAGRVRYC